MILPPGFLWCDNCLSLHRAALCTQPLRFSTRPDFLPKRLEKEAQAGVMEYLRIRGDLHSWRQNTMGAKYGDRYVKSSKKGTSDILCCQAPTGRLVGIEMKKEGEMPTDDQLEFGAKIITCGGLWFCSYDIAHCEAMLGPPRHRVDVQSLERRKRVYPP